jgi:hypothetical protein
MVLPRYSRMSSYCWISSTWQGTMFCRTCVPGGVLQWRYCMCCGKMFEDANIHPATFASTAINRLLCRCPCGSVLPVGKLDGHKLVCPAATQVCPFGCGWQGSMDSEHHHVSVCPLLPKQCDTCSLMFTLGRIGSHQDEGGCQPPVDALPSTDTVS